MAGLCTPVATATSIDVITSQSLIMVPFPSPTTLPPTVVPVTLAQLGPAAIQFGSKTIPGKTTVVFVTSISTLRFLSSHTETLFGTVCGPAPTAAAPTSAAVTTAVVISSSGPSTSDSASALPEALSIPFSTSIPTVTQVPTQASQGTVTFSATETIALLPSTTPPQSGNDSVDTEKGSIAKSHMAAIVGGSIGGCILLLIILVLGWYLLRRRRRRPQSWDGIFKEKLTSGDDENPRPQPRIKTTGLGAVEPFPLNVSPTSGLRDVKNNGRASPPSFVQSPLTDWSQSSAYHRPSGSRSQEPTYVQYQYPDQGYGYNYGVKQGEMGTGPFTPSPVSFSQNPYDGISPVPRRSPEGKYHVNNGSVGSSSSTSLIAGGPGSIDAPLAAVNPFVPVSSAGYQLVETSDTANQAQQSHPDGRQQQAPSNHEPGSGMRDPRLAPPSYTEA